MTVSINVAHTFFSNIILIDAFQTIFYSTMQNLYNILLCLFLIFYVCQTNPMLITKIKACLKQYNPVFIKIKMLLNFSTNSTVLNTILLFLRMTIVFNICSLIFFHFSQICDLIGHIFLCVPIILVTLLNYTEYVQNNLNSPDSDTETIELFFDSKYVDKLFNEFFSFFLEKPFLDIFFLQYICIFGPLIASIYSGLLGHFLNKFYIIRTTIIYLFISFIIALDYFCNLEMYNLTFGDQTLLLTTTMFNWFQYGIEISFYLLFDHLSVLMLIVVLLVSFLVHIYSINYMAEDPHFFRFFSYLSAFTFFMIFMVVSSNFIQFFIGWEGIGVFSMLLINFWFTRIQANKAALKAVLVNRIGDIFLLFAMGFSAYFFDTLNFETLRIFFDGDSNMISVYKNYEFLYKTTDFFRFFAISLLLASMVKSAQIGFYIWLPDAMEGPTPVSALLHAATMVTAGVYLLLRFSFVFELYGDLLFILGIFSMFTSLFAGLVALYQYDIKKIIAYSTCSQLALMFVAISFSKYTVAFFHLFTHAWFKALLFLTAGVIIHALRGEQDLRRMGGLLKILPFSALSLFFGTLAIIGFPMLSGFYSKETILFFMLTDGKQNLFTESIILFIFFLFTSLLTALYSFRLFFLTFFRKPNGFKYYYFHIHNAANATLFSLGVLCILTLFSGYVFSDIFIGYGSGYGDLIFSSLYLNEQQVSFEFFPSFLKDFLFNSNVFLFLILFQTYGTSLFTRKQFSLLYICEYICEFLFHFFRLLYMKILHFFLILRKNWKNPDFWVSYSLSMPSFYEDFGIKMIDNDCPCKFCSRREDSVSKSFFKKSVAELIFVSEPIRVYFWYNGFLLNNFFNKILYFFIEKGHFIFSIILERYYMTYYVYHFVFFNFLKHLNIFLANYFTFQKIVLSLFFYFILLIILSSCQEFVPSVFFLDILHDINV